MQPPYLTSTFGSNCSELELKITTIGQKGSSRLAKKTFFRERIIFLIRPRLLTLQDLSLQKNCTNGASAKTANSCRKNSDTFVKLGLGVNRYANPDNSNNLAKFQRCKEKASVLRFLNFDCQSSSLGSFFVGSGE